MSRQVDRSDAAFEGWLRGAVGELRAAEPASDALSARVASIPDRVPSRSLLGSLVDGQPGALLVAGLAAAVAVLVLSTAFRSAPNGLGAGIAPPATFDPTIVGPGIVTGVMPSLLFARWVVAVIVLVIAFRLRPAGRGRPLMSWLPAGVGLLIAVVASPIVPLNPGLEHGSFYGLTRGFDSEHPIEKPFDPRSLYYEMADPGQPTILTISLRNSGVVPIRIEGIVGDLGDVFLAAQPWRAVWLAPDDGHTIGDPDIARPFAPTTIAPGAELEVFLVGRAGPCAYGSTFQVGDDAETGDLQLSPVVDVAYSMFGLSSTTPIELEMDLAEPVRPNCS